MKTNIILFQSYITFILFTKNESTAKYGKTRIFTHKENGWYHVLSTGSLSSKPIITVKDFVGLKT